MRAVLVIATKELRQRLRDRSALVLGFVAPIAIATLMSIAFRSTDDFSFTIADRSRNRWRRSLAAMTRAAPTVTPAARCP